MTDSRIHAHSYGMNGICELCGEHRDSVKKKEHKPEPATKEQVEKLQKSIDGLYASLLFMFAMTGVWFLVLICFK